MGTWQVGLVNNKAVRASDLPFFCGGVKTTYVSVSQEKLISPSGVVGIVDDSRLKSRR